MRTETLEGKGDDGCMSAAATIDSSSLFLFFFYRPSSLRHFFWALICIVPPRCKYVQYLGSKLSSPCFQISVFDGYSYMSIN